jgi:lactoylglutathione lyase
MHLGSIYLIVNDFKKSIAFYEKLLNVLLENGNNGRFVSFTFEGHRISLLNAHFDTDYPEKVVRKGEDAEVSGETLLDIASAPNTHKFVFNFWVEDLRTEYERIKNLGITNHLTGIKYVCYVAPYYYFQLTDPDENMIEVTGSYTPEDGEFH